MTLVCSDGQKHWRVQFLKNVKAVFLVTLLLSAIGKQIDKLLKHLTAARYYIVTNK